MRGRTRIVIDYALCGDGKGVDPRSCSACLRICDPALFLLHQTFGVEDDPLDPQKWRVTPLWIDRCSRCMKCVSACPAGAIAINWRA